MIFVTVLAQSFCRYSEKVFHVRLADLETRILMWKRKSQMRERSCSVAGSDFRYRNGNKNNAGNYEIFMISIILTHFLLKKVCLFDFSGYSFHFRAVLIRVLVTLSKKAVLLYGFYRL